MSVDPGAPFEEPWQVRAFALAQGLLQSTGTDREEFRRRLISAIRDDPGRPYWESWVTALESLVATLGLSRQ